MEIHTINDAVDQYNNEEIKKMMGKSYIYNAKVTGDIPCDKYPNAISIELKPGSKVMFLKNDRNNIYQNGTFGIVKECFNDGVIVSIGEEDVYITPYEEDIPDDPIIVDETKKIVQKYIGKFKQIPLRLAYAITVHKSQGQTFEYVNFDPKGDKDNILEVGQLYVALSRAKTIDGLFLYNCIDKDAWNTSSKVKRFYEENV